MSEAIDREELRRDLADALSAIQKDHSVAGLDVLADALSKLGEPYALHGRAMVKALESVPRNYSALIWNLVRVLMLLEDEGKV
jgi:hypothetical protein